MGLRVDFHNLACFVASAEELNFTHAAERMHVFKISKQIRNLEAEIGVKLFHRGNKGVALTPAGRSFLADARRILSEVAEFHGGSLGMLL
jgi:DNA-binding transcriptional LysR family regulator